MRLDVAIVAAPDTRSARDLLKAASQANAVFACGLTVACLIFAGTIASALGSDGLQPWLYLVGLNVFALGQYQVLVYWMNRRKNYTGMATSRVFQAGAVNGTQLALGSLAFGVNGLIIGTVFGHLASLIQTNLRRRQEVRLAIPTSGFLEILRTNWRMPVLNGTSAVADAVRINGINVAIAAAYSQQALGFFSLAWRTVFLPISLVSGTLAQVFYERFSVTSPGSMRKEATKSAALCAALGAPPFALLAFTAEPLFGLVFGDRWRSAGRIAELLTPYLYLTFITSPLSTLFLVVRQQSLLMIFSIAYMIVPLIIVVRTHTGIVAMVWRLSQGMSIMLGVFLMLAAFACHRFDRRPMPHSG